MYLPRLNSSFTGLQFTWPRLILKLRYDLFLTICLTCFGLISLGQWQLGKANALIARKESLVEIHTLNIEISESDQLKTVLLENQPREGRLGYRVFTLVPLPDNSVILTPGKARGKDLLSKAEDPSTTLRMTEKTFILIDRGWIAAPASRADLPSIPKLSEDINGELSLKGHFYAPWKNPFVAFASEITWTETDDLIRLQALDLDYLESLWHHPLARNILKLEDQSPGCLAYLKEESRLTPERHQGYAFQWFGLALTLIIASIFAAIKRKNEDTHLEHA
jgi:surfeit locus 1 family protein